MFKLKMSFPRCSLVKNSPANAGDVGLIPGSGRSPGEGNDTSIQCSLPGKSPGQRSLVGYSPWGRKRAQPAIATEQQQAYNENGLGSSLGETAVLVVSGGLTSS